MKPQAIIFIGSNTTSSGITFLQKAHELGFIPILLHRAKDPIQQFANVHSAVFYQADIDQREQVDVAIQQIELDYHIAGITTSSDYSIVMVAEQAVSRGLPAPNPESVRQCRDKIRQREILHDAKVSQPAYKAVHNAHEAMKAYDDLNDGNGVIIKPADGTGSVGVYRVNSPVEMQTVATELFQNVFNTRGQRRETTACLVEEFIRGNEVSVEVFHGHIVGITQKHVTDPPRFLETGHDFPANSLSKQEQTAIETTAVAALKALGLTFGPLHIELRYRDGVAYIIEVNARLAGGSLPTLFEECGHDMIQKTLAAIVGIAVPKSIPSKKYASIRYFRATASGVLGGLTGTEEYINDPDVSLTSYSNEGESVVGNTGDFRERIGHVIVTGENPDEVIRKITTIHSQIQVIIR